MVGSYCHYCGNRCFVERTVFVDGKRLIVNHWATCNKGVAHDRGATLRKYGVAIDHHIALDMGALPATPAKAHQ